MKIVLDAGHGPNTPGKRSPDDSLREYHFNSAVAYYTREELLNYENVEVLFVHDGNRDVPLSERTSKANNWGARTYISIHANAAGNGDWNAANGIETFTHPNASRESVTLAKLVQDELIKATKRRDRGIKTANFQVLREAKMPAILIEAGFMTNKEEAELLKSDHYRKLCASAIVKALVFMYGLKKKEVKQVTGPFKDVPKDHWASAAIEKVKAAGLMQGFPDGTFKPNEPMTRAQMATVIANMLKK